MTASHCTACGAAGSGGRFCAECGTPRVLVSEVGPPADALRRQLAAATEGEYRILGELGRGGMAAVFLAEDLSLGRRVAIKVMIPGLDRTDGMADRFLLEARTAGQLSHPHIIPIYAVRTTGDLRFFVMRYVAGRSLDRVLADRGPLEVAVVQAVLSHVGQALEHAHGRGVVHRDIKPANIMLDEDGTPIVADFGIAKVGQGASLTQTGSTMGTPTYMSPEQCTGRPVTGASDQYALGCVLFELLTGQPPFVHQEVVPVLLAHVAEPPPPLLPRRPDCPYPLAATVDRMLAKDPADRWPRLSDAIEAGADLRSVHDPAVRQSLQVLAAGEVGGPAPVPQVASLAQAASPLPGAAIPSPSLTRVRGEGPGAQVGARSPGTVQSPAAVAPRVTEPDVEVRAPAEVLILPDGGTLSVGQVVRLNAYGRAPAGRGPRLASAEWFSEDPATLRVTPEGEVSALRPGGGSIVVRAAGVEARVRFQVTRVDVASVRILPRLGGLAVGETVNLTAKPTDRLGAVLSGRVVCWTSSDPEVAVVEPDGTILGVSAGTTRVSASVGSGLAWVDLRVTAAQVGTVRLEPSTLTLRSGEVAAVKAILLGGRGGSLTGIPVAWESSDPAIAIVDGEGRVTARRFGMARIAATAGGRRATLAVEVRPIGGNSGSQPGLG